MRQILLVIFLIVGTLAGPLIALATAPPPAPGDIHLVIAPADRARAIVARAGGTEISPLSAPLGILATSQDAGFATRLRAAGAWFVIDGRAVARLCGASA